MRLGHFIPGSGLRRRVGDYGLLGRLRVFILKYNVEGAGFCVQGSEFSAFAKRKLLRLWLLRPAHYCSAVACRAATAHYSKIRFTSLSSCFVSDCVVSCSTAPNCDVFPSAGGLHQGIDQFDGDFFGVSEAELRSMDPHQRLGQIVPSRVYAVVQDGSNRERKLKRQHRQRKQYLWLQACCGSCSF